MFFFFNDTATTEIYTLSLHDALPISMCIRRDVAPEKNERRVAVAFRQVAEHLVVRAVLADDVHDMLDRRRAAGRRRHNGRCTSRERSPRGRPAVRIGAGRERPELSGGRK